MRNNYKVLLCDDSQTWIDSIHDDLYDTIRSSTGLFPDIDPVTTQEEFFKRNCNEYDLFLFDYKLHWGSQDGSNVIAGIRANKVYTTVIFYSSQDTLFDEIASKQLDGVYVCDRSNGDDLLQKVRDVSYLSVKRLLDPSTLRGLFLTSVAELEAKMDTILPKAHDLLMSKYSPSEHHRDFVADYVDKVKSNFDEFIEAANEEKNNISKLSFDFKSMIERPAFLDLYKKISLITTIIFNGKIQSTFRATFNKYNFPLNNEFALMLDHEIRLFRNELAHKNEDDILKSMAKQITNVQSNPTRYKQLFSDWDLGSYDEDLFKYLHYIVTLIKNYSDFFDSLDKCIKTGLADSGTQE